MSKFYHGAKQHGPYFEGWYLKYQTMNEQSIALIPALHIDAAGKRSASLQVITSCKSWWLDFPAASLQASEDKFSIVLDKNTFTAEGVELNIHQNELTLHGKLNYGSFTPLKSDIMGPFRFFPGMECAHGIISMQHPICGQLTLNGEILNFGGGTGYIETDRGRSFPSRYLWTQCIWKDRRLNSLMLSIASIPLPIGHFTGCICAVIYGGQEYRLATYHGVQIDRWARDGAVIRQGKLRLEAALLEEQARPLRAPVKGIMARTVHESISAKVRYRFYIGEQLLFEHTDGGAGFEYADDARK